LLGGFFIYMPTLIQIDEDKLREMIEQAVAGAVGSALKKALEPEFVTTATAAKMLSLSIHTLVAWRARRLIPYHRIGGRVLYSLVELREFVAAHRVKRKDARDVQR
jgi:DNA-binding HxlR family transcriptional regulator